MGWYGTGVACGVLVADGTSVVYVALFGVQTVWMCDGEVGTAAPGVGKQYTSNSDWQPAGKSSTSMPLLQSSSLSQQYCVCCAICDESVALKLIVIVTLGVAVGFIVGVYQDVVKLGAAESAVVAETHAETRGLVL